MYKPRILAFSGSLRKESWNTKLVHTAADSIADIADVTKISLADYPLPVFSQDDEARDGMHPNARTLKDMFIATDGFLISSPEYNSSISAALKNTIDWVSRADGDEAGLISLRGKVAGLMSASPGALGGLRGLVHLRAILQNVGVMVVPNQRAVGGVMKLFDDAGRLNDDATVKAIGKVAAALVNTAQRMHEET